jgi:hypothetical protein
MTASPGARQLRNQGLLRDVNGRILEVLKAELLDLSTNGNHETEFVCECRQEACNKTVSLTVDEYEAVRSSPTVFVVLPGHESPEVMDTLLTNERFSLVEKRMFAEPGGTGDPRAA